MHRGYVKVWRKLLDSEISSYGLDALGLFTVLLLRANWKKSRFKGRDIPAGSLVTTTGGLAAEFGCSRSKIIRMLTSMSECGVLTFAGVDNRFTLLSICNYDRYQSCVMDDRTTDDTTIGQRSDNHRTTDPRKDDSINNLGLSKKARREEGKNIPSPDTAPAQGIHADFEEIWALYPNKSDKPQAKAAYIKARKSGTGREAALAGLDRYKRHVESARAGGFNQRYQAGRTWFEGRGWESEWETSRPEDTAIKKPLQELLAERTQ